jgi:hypothetical protein
LREWWETIVLVFVGLIACGGTLLLLDVRRSAFPRRDRGPGRPGRG